MKFYFPSEIHTCFLHPFSPQQGLFHPFLGDSSQKSQNCQFYIGHERESFPFKGIHPYLCLQIRTHQGFHVFCFYGNDQKRHYLWSDHCIFLFRESEHLRCCGNGLRGSKWKEHLWTGMMVYCPWNKNIKIKKLLKCATFQITLAGLFIWINKPKLLWTTDSQLED